MKQYIRIFTLFILCFAGMQSEAWADVTYIILTKPFNVRNAANTDNYKENIRLEALRCTSTGTTVYLPDAFRSPLAKNFQYWKTPTVTANTKLYDDTGTSPKVLQTKYDIYEGVANKMTENSTLESNGNPTTIYVTYDYDDTNNILKLDGAHKYNIALNSGNNLRYLCFNKNRNNRPAAALASTVSAEDLISDDFVTNVNGFDGTKSVHYQFYLCGEDPYNITIMTAYEGNGTYNEKLEVEGTAYKKPFKGSTIFAKLASTDNNNGTANMWLSPDAHKHYKSTTDENVFDSWEGFYKSNMNPIFNAVAVLPKGSGYFFVASKLNQNGTIYQPNASGYYATLTDDGKNPRMLFKAIANAIPMEPDPVTTYTFNVKTSFGNTISATAEWSDAYKDAEITTSHMPESLKRKYCGYVGFYKDAALTQAITKFSDVPADGNIYVKYEVSGAPFTAISPSASYTTATWYELTDAGSNQASGKKLKYDDTNSVFKNNGANGEYVKESEFAFIGDPYELRIINRDQTVNATPSATNYYVGCADPSTNTNLDVSSTDGAHYKWEIPYDDTDGSFTLREFGSTNAYWNWTTSTSENTIQYSTTASTRIKVMELPKFTYTYNVVDLAGNIAIKATVEQTIFTPISGYASIPSSVRSPFLADETITYYDSYTDRNVDGKINRLDFHNPSEQDDITETPPVNNQNIYVTYTTTQLSSKSIKLIYSQQFNVKLNGEYIYWNSESGSDQNKILSENLAANDAKLETSAYLWHLRGRDPYSMRIDNKGYSENQFGHDPISTTTGYFYDPAGDGTYTSGSPETIANGMFVRVKDDTWGDNKALEFVNNRENASRFVAMMGGYAGVYEVLAATGTTDLYHIGRASTTGAETKIYNTATYAHGTDQLRFELAGSTVITYTLVDKAQQELFTVTSTNPRLALPSEYQSPLVEEYYYYPTKTKAITALTANKKDPKSADAITEIDQDDDSDPTDDNHVWVTYKVNDNVKFNTATNTTNNPYLLRFHNGKSYYLEDGADKLDLSGKVQAMYPYTNGDGNLNVYSEATRDEQMNGGSSTRSRWVWFFLSENEDPYHVKIHSKNKIKTSVGEVFVYFHTYAVHFNQDADASTTHIVTGSTLPGVWKAGTEYMVLGTTGNYKLLTTEPVPIDLNGDGDTSDEGESAGERQYVTSFEQYWKTYNMIKLYLLNINKSTDKDSKDPADFVMPSEKWDDLKTALTEKGVNNSSDLNYMDGCSWHSYNAIANALRWNGYDDEGRSNTKKVEELEHWYQSFDMGDGTFAIENGEVPLVLVLLDRHGWEIMRKPIPMGSSDPEAETKLAALKVFDSPMVKEYKFYSNADKVSNCHKYELRMQNGAERDQIKEGGKQFTSTSLGTLPSYKADQDLFVTYTVKEEYDKSYQYTFTPIETEPYYTEEGTPSAFIVIQNHQYAKENGSSITPTSWSGQLSDEIIADAAKEESLKTFTQNELWYIQPNLDIDDEMGLPWPWWTSSNKDNPYNKIQTKQGYYDKNRTGFDPYNIQLKNVSTGKFFTIDMKKSVLGGGVFTGDYTGGSLNVTLADKCTSPIPSPESHDHSTLQMTNQTFMAVQDANGNMQLMPRFDHSHRINAFTTLADPSTHAAAEVDDASPGAQTTFMVRPQVFDYKVIDNQGEVALRYKTGGEFYPSMPAHFKSPLATDFKFYKTLEETNDDGKFDLATLADEITSSFAAAGIMDNADIYIRYDYNDTYDTDNQNILQGQWLTMSLAVKDVQATGELDPDTGEGISLYTGTKDATANKWQWKFLQNPMAPSSELYVAPDPYRVAISNREANYDDPESPSPTNKMGTAIKISGKDRFVIMSHPSGDYALLAAGDGLKYSFLNGGSMTEPSTTAASVEEEGSFTKTSNTISADARIIFTEDVTHTYTYYIINNSSKLAASETQDYATALSNEFKPVVPYNIQSPLINDDDYLYYGTVIKNNNETPEDPSDDTYTLDDRFVIDNLYGLFDDNVYVHYPEFSRDNTPYMVPNARNATSPVEVGSGANDVAIDINGQLPYNIIWLSDNMMRSSDGTNIIDGGTNSYNLSGETADKWHFTGNDPYAIKIKHDSGDMYVDGDGSLNATAKNYMLLKKDGYDYGVFAETGNQANMLTFSDPGTGYTLNTTTSDPAKFIPFALSVHHLIYHLVINTSKVNTNIPYRKGNEDSPGTLTSVDIPGTTQRNLADTYQLGSTIYFKGAESTTGITYCYDAGKVSLGDVLEVPSELKRPNCRYYYYVQDIYDNYNEAYNASTGESTGGTDKRCEDLNSTLNNKYKGLKMDDEIPTFIKKSDLIGKTVVVNITYSFDTGLPTNAGDGFVTDVNQNTWYTFETNEATPYLAHYTNAWGLQAMEGRETRYTNDYLWLPLGDAYGFKMYNRYMKKNSSELGDDNTKVMTTESINEGAKLRMLEPVDSDPGEGQILKGNEVYELLASNTAGYFRVHPVINKTGTQYFVRRITSSGDIDSDGIDDKDYTILSTTATEWTFGLTTELIQPYIDRINYVGGLKSEVANSTDFVIGEKHINVKELITALKNGSITPAQLMDLQLVVYDVNNIVDFKSGYYRLHNQPDVSDIDPVRYASGYLHDIEQTAVSGGIPMHFYSKQGVSTTFAGDGGLSSGFTVSNATRGEIPIPATEYDPSSIFYIKGSVSTNKTISTATLSTQGLNVVENRMTTSPGQTFTMMDIGSGVFLIHDGSAPATRMYLNFDQSSDKDYDLQYYHESPTDDAKWCLEPANNQGLLIETHMGDNDYFYCTFCAPYDVTLPDDATGKTYDAYVCTVWNTEVIHPTSIGKTIPAGTPVIIRTTDNSRIIKVTLPGTASSATSCVFTGKYLEQKLTEIDDDDKVYTFGSPITGYNLTIDAAGGFENGEVNNVASGVPAHKGVGFYLNATPNKEKSATSGEWTPNNRYVLHNKIYYRAPDPGVKRLGDIKSAPQFVPVIFDYEEEGGELQPDGQIQQQYDGDVYDLSGRKVATEEQVKDGTWKQILRPGIYIVGGKKIKI